MSKLETSNLVEWFYDCKGSQYGYLLLNSEDEYLIQDIKDKLISLGIECFKHGKSFRLASNEKKYKTYLSIAKLSGGCLTFQELKKIIKDNFQNFHFDASSAEIRRYVNTLKESISTKDNEIDRLKKHLPTLTLYYKKQLRKFEEENKEALKKLQENSSDNSWNEVIDAEFSRHKKREEELEELYTDEIERYKSDIENLNIKLEQSEKQIEELEYNSSTIKSSRKDDKTRSFLRCFLPKLIFDSESINYIEYEIIEIKYLLNYLKGLNDQVDKEKKLDFKKFEGLPDWLEVDKRISDGQSSIVRIYYKFDKVLNIYCVHVSDKHYQLKGSTKYALKNWKAE